MRQIKNWMNMDEQLFKEIINEKLMEWLVDYAIDLHQITDEFELIEFEGFLFKEFLYIDEAALSDVFREKYNTELTIFFCDHYKHESLIDFILFIIHFIFEENINIIIHKIEYTGCYCGHWATAYFRESYIQEIINQRYIELRNLRIKFSNYYKDLYSKAINVRYHLTTENENYNAPDLIKHLVGVSGATLFFGFILNFKMSSISLWKNTISNTQIMFNLGETFGSINFFGFCLEKSKPGPKKESKYESISVEDLNDTVSEAVKRIKYFISYFIEYSQTSNHVVLETAKKYPNKVWFHFQLYFWLITQPFSKNEGDNSEWEFFFKTKKREIYNIEGVDFGLESEYIIDNQYAELNNVSIQILSNIENAIHPSNISIFKDIINKCNVE